MLVWHSTALALHWLNQPTSVSPSFITMKCFWFHVIKPSSINMMPCLQSQILFKGRLRQGSVCVVWGFHGCMVFHNKALVASEISDTFHIFVHHCLLLFSAFLLFSHTFSFNLSMCFPDPLLPHLFTTLQYSPPHYWLYFPNNPWAFKRQPLIQKGLGVK